MIPHFCAQEFGVNFEQLAFTIASFIQPKMVIGSLDTDSDSKVPFTDSPDLQKYASLDFKKTLGID